MSEKLSSRLKRQWEMQAVGDAREKLCLDDHRKLQKEVEAYAYRSLQGVFQGHYAEITGGGVHFLEDCGQIHTGAVLCAVPEKFKARKVGEGSLRSKVGDPQGALQGP